MEVTGARQLQRNRLYSLINVNVLAIRLKTDEVHKSQNQSDSAKESELKEFLTLLSDHRHTKSDLAFE